MGKASRTKRNRREVEEYVSSLTHCEGSWIEKAPDRAEQQRVADARRELSKHRSIAVELSSNEEATNKFSLEVLRDGRFHPLYFEDWVIEDVIAAHGEPPVVETEDDPAFSDYLRAAITSIANSRSRRALGSQASRFIPGLVDDGKLREAMAVEYNIYMTIMSDAVTPLLAQAMVGGLARYYEEHTEEEEEEAQEA